MKWQLNHTKNMTVYAGKRLEISTFRHIHLEDSKLIQIIREGKSVG